MQTWGRVRGQDAPGAQCLLLHIGLLEPNLEHSDAHQHCRTIQSIDLGEVTEKPRQEKSPGHRAGGTLAPPRAKAASLHCNQRLELELPATVKCATLQEMKTQCLCLWTLARYRANTAQDLVARLVLCPRHSRSLVNQNTLLLYEF